ncbi:MAG TPA: 16S rRNA (adenine(1518)-N(6)/adenine(1519)-N(6))-dimethyltransferase RsmA [Anaerolineae bacterium]|nr:16S rRNA (adenine(1518)-N(6)/adenine(1519)-N(6))-dimethyltransferase RsmA [Anaerolineae bacterium]
MLEPRQLLKQFGLRPKKSLGQNFLIDNPALDKIVRAADVTADDVVLEIGPGLGSLTQHLAAIAKRVIAVEIDGNLIPVLHSQLADRSNVEIVQGDILKIDPATLLREASTYKVVANIPYYITSGIIRHLLEASITPSLLVLTIQQEVAERIIAQPDDMNLLAVSVQFYGSPRIVTNIQAGAFYPAPKVDSAVVRIDLDAKPRVEVKSVDTFFSVVKAGFSQKRKQIHNSLIGGLGKPREEIDRLLQAGNIDPKRRAETLTLEEWAGLANLVDQGSGIGK